MKKIMKLNYWAGKNVLITGVNGFIGGNLTKALLQKGANIYGLIRNNNKNTYICFEKLIDQIVTIKGELEDKELMARIISEERINVVFHFAAQVEIGVGLSNPYLTFETNIRGTYTLLEAVRLHPDHIEAVVVASSDKAYGSYDRKMMPYKEDYPLKPVYPYDTSKACADMIAKAYSNEIYRLPILVTRFANIFGPGQLNFSALIPDAIASALGISRFIPRSDGSMVRDFIYSEDVADLYIRISENLAKDPKKYIGETFNAGTNKPITVRSVLKAIYTKTGNIDDYEDILKSMKKQKTKGEISYQCMDYKKVNDFFNWSPSHSFDEGLVKTIEWYKRYLKVQSSS